MDDTMKSLKGGIWKVTETGELWNKSWLSYDENGKMVGGQITIFNGSIELIQAVAKAFAETEGQKIKKGGGVK